MANSYKPGEKADRSGQYEIVGPRGGRTGIERTVVKGEPLPPTQRSGQRYIMVDVMGHTKRNWGTLKEAVLSAIKRYLNRNNWTQNRISMHSGPPHS